VNILLRIKSENYHFPSDEADKLSEKIRQAGCFQSEPIVPSGKYEKISDGIKKLHEAGILPVFIAVYDEFWQLLYKLRYAFDPILGEIMDYHLTFGHGT